MRRFIAVKWSLLQCPMLRDKVIRRKKHPIDDFPKQILKRYIGGWSAADRKRIMREVKELKSEGKDRESGKRIEGDKE